MATPRRTEHKRIVLDPEILAGKPVVSGTRIPVELILKRFAEDLDIGALLQAYPRLTIDDIRACMEYAAGVIEGEDVYPRIVTDTSNHAR